MLVVPVNLIITGGKGFIYNQNSNCYCYTVF